MTEHTPLVLILTVAIYENVLTKRIPRQVDVDIHWRRVGKWSYSCKIVLDCFYC